MAMSRYEWKIEKSESLLSFLQKKIPEALSPLEVSKSKIRRLVMAGAVRVNGNQIRIPAYNLRTGDLVLANVEEEKFFYEKKPDDIDFTLTESDVLFEDDFLLIVNKPAFFPTEETIVQGRGNMHQAAVDYLWKKNPGLRNPPYVGIMHRLDRETSGTLLFTKSRSVNNAVHEMFEKHTAVKKYRAVCAVEKGGKSAQIKENFFVENYIGRISPKSSKCKIGVLAENRGGQFARTDFTLAARDEKYAYIDCTLLTGRTHQIRVHLSGVGLPIVGDDLYGGPAGFSENNGRIMLHAFSLSFKHPVSGEDMEIVAPLPPLFSPRD